MLVAVSLESQVFHEISWIYQNSQDCMENSLNHKLISKFPKSWENSQAVAVLYAITQCYLPPGKGDIPTCTPAKTGFKILGLPQKKCSGGKLAEIS